MQPPARTCTLDLFFLDSSLVRHDTACPVEPSLTKRCGFLPVWPSLLRDPSFSTAGPQPWETCILTTHRRKESGYRTNRAHRTRRCTSRAGLPWPAAHGLKYIKLTRSCSAPFHSQFEYLTQNQNQPSIVSGSPSMNTYGQQSFDMGALAASLPQNLQPGVTQRPYGAPDASHNVSASSPYASQQAMFTQPRGPTFDPALLARAQQQQQYLNAHYGAPGPMQRPQQLAMQGQLAYSPIDPYGYGMAPSQYSPIDPRFVTQNSFSMGAMHADMSTFKSWQLHV